MNDEIPALIRLSGRSLVALMSEAPGFHARLERNAALVLSGENSADLNMLLVGEGDGAERLLEETLALVRERRLPLLVLSSPRAADGLAPVAARHGLAEGGTLPLMLLCHAAEPAGGAAYDVIQALGADGARVAGDLQSAAFSIPRDIITRTMEPGMIDTAQAETYLALRDGIPMSSVTATRMGDTVGIWSMATPVEHQRKGAGRALLTHVTEIYRRQGARRFFLLATAAGKPLYERLGFRTTADFRIWVLGHSTQISH